MFPRGIRSRSFQISRECITRLKIGLLRRRHELPAITLQSLGVDDVRQLTPMFNEQICLPPFYGPAHDDYSALLGLIKHVNPRVVLELGTAYGNTVANICYECPSARVYTVNAAASTQSGIHISFELATEEIGRIYRSAGYSTRVVQILENTLNLNLSKFFDGPVVDICIVDACHDTAYVTNDFHKVEPYVKPGGIVLLHDTDPSMRGHLRGSYVACMTLRRRGYDVRHLTGTWWGIWIKPA